MPSTYVDGIGDEVLASLAVALLVGGGAALVARRRSAAAGAAAGAPRAGPLSPNDMHAALVGARRGAPNAAAAAAVAADDAAAAAAAIAAPDAKADAPAAAPLAPGGVAEGAVDGQVEGASAVAAAAAAAARALAEQKRMEALRKGVDCPVCLSPAVHAVQTSCGHCFCGSCFVRYWDQTARRAQLACPVCRALIRFAVPSFALRALADDAEAAARQALVDAAQRGVAAPEDVAPAAPHPLEADAKRDAEPAAAQADGALPAAAAAEAGGEGKAAADAVRAIDAACEAYSMQWEGSRRAVAQHLSFGARAWAQFGRLPLLSKLVLVLLGVCALLYVVAPMDLLPDAGLGVVGLIDDIVVLLLTLVLMGVYYRLLLIRNQRYGY